MASAFGAEFVPLSAVLSGVKDIREAIAQAQQVLQQSGRHTILFRGRSASLQQIQQDAFLPFVSRLGHFHRRHHRESVVRSQQRAVARPSVCAACIVAEELAQLFERARKIALQELEFDDDARERITAMRMAMHGAC